MGRTYLRVSLACRLQFIEPQDEREREREIVAEEDQSVLVMHNIDYSLPDWAALLVIQTTSNKLCRAVPRELAGVLTSTDRQHVKYLDEGGK